MRRTSEMSEDVNNHYVDLTLQRSDVLVEAGTALGMGFDFGAIGFA